MSADYQPETVDTGDGATARKALTALRGEISKAVVGQDAVITGLVIALLCRGHVLLEGVPGTAKTLLVRALAQSLALDFRRVQFTPDLMPGDVTGSLIYDNRTSEFEFREGPAFTNLLLADEINRTPPKTQASLLEAMEERQISVEGLPRPLPDPFMVCATQNPIEYEGTYPLPEAQLDRFLVKLNVPVPGRDDEIAVLQRHAGGFDPRDLSAIDRVAGVEELSAGREAVRKVHIDPKISGYVVDLCRATRQSPSLQLGVSPRGATALLATSRAWAWLSGRDYVTPDDVKALARPTLRHRIQLRPEADLEGATADGVLEGVLTTVPAPRLGGPSMALTGRTGLLAALGAIVLLFVPHWWVLLAVEGALLIGVVADLAMAGNVRRLRLHRSGDTNVRLGETANVSLIVENLGRRRVKARLRDAWPPSAGATPVAAATSRSGRTRSDVKLTIPAGERRRMDLTLTPTRRGDRKAASVTVRSAGPLGLAARQLSRPASWTLRVLPGFPSRRHLPGKLAKLRELTGNHVALIRGQGTEFDSLREYVDGDDVRSIDWRATARRADVVVRTWRPERDRRIYLVLDTGRTAAGRVGDIPRLDCSMDAALLLGALASRAGDRVDLLAYDRRVRARVEGVSRTDLLTSMVQAMAPLEPTLIESDAAGMVSTIMSKVRQRCLVVLLTELNSAAIEEGLLPLLPQLTSRHLLMIAAVSDPRVTEMAAARGDLAAVYDAAAAERARAERRRLTAELRRYGVEVVDAPPDEIAPALADAYLSLKAAGRL